MKLMYMGFSHETTGVRQYSFEGVVSDGIRKGFLVTADIALLTKHHVRIQEVPMMCLRLLESSSETDPQPELLVLTEADMILHVRVAAAAKAASKRTRGPFRPTNPVAFGMVWKSQKPV